MLHVVLPVLDADNIEGGRKQIANGMGFSGGNDIVVSLRLLQHPPHRIHIITGIAPVAPRLEVAHHELVHRPSLMAATPRTPFWSRIRCLAAAIRD